MSSMRINRVSELIREALGDILNKIKDPRIGFITVTSVEVTPDLDIARVFVSVLGEEEQVNDTLKGLESAAGFVRRELGKEIRLRKTPRIVFTFDPGIERGSRILELLNSIKKEDHEEDQEDQLTEE